MHDEHENNCPAHKAAKAAMRVFARRLEKAGVPKHIQEQAVDKLFDDVDVIAHNAIWATEEEQEARMKMN
jgi:hypothetical protein